MIDTLAAINFITGDDRPSLISCKMQWNGQKYGMFSETSVNPSQAEIDEAIDMTLENMVRLREKLSNPCGRPV